MSIQQAYNQWSDSYDTDRNLTRDLDQRITRETLTNLQFNSILELGCGTGKNTSFYAQLGKKVHAVDFSQGMIDKAKEKVKTENVKFFMMDITKRWIFDDDSFDLVVCNLVLEHIQDISFVFSEASRVLQKKGRFFINELHPFKQYEGKKARYQKDGEEIEVDAFVHHISEFIKAASDNSLAPVKLNEYWHEEDQNKPPRIVSFMFEK
ncbi:MAG TPA: class I SAM-dependent methyltransferase [Anaerolineales bacterium]|nr:class I SAM-dependent methyltransferase [Anaerolineales bacterium]